MKLTANPASESLPVQQRRRCFGAQLLRIMRLTTIIILAACLQSAANGVAQNTVTISGKEVSLEYVFNAIKKQTTYRFFFNTDMLQHTSKVSIEVKNAPIDQVMHLALKDQPLTFAIKGRTIFIMKKEEEKSSGQQLPPSGDPITVSGRVTDEQGEPLVGANVNIKGTNTGVTTDNQGRFTLNSVDPNAMLEISFVGHETQLLSVKGKSVFIVALGQKIGTLDETVVIAYGTTTKRFSTGNVSSVKAADIEKQPVLNPLLALQGRVPGLFITQANGLPGGAITVRIQGQNSIRSGNTPFYVIDGVPYTSQLLTTTGTGFSPLGRESFGPGNGSGNPLSYINPSDIESIDVLKDADATAIYGSRAANGAILITTKKGKAGQTKVNVDMQNGWGKVTRKLELLNSRQYLDMRYEAYKNDGIALSSLTPNNSNYDLTLWDTTRYTDWQETLIGGTAKFATINASVSGGNANTQYLIGGAYQRQTSVFPGSFSDQKGSVHINFNSASSNQKFRLRFSGNYLVDKNQLPLTDLTERAIKLAPVAPPVYKEDGTLNWMPNSNGASSWANPLSFLYNIYENKTNNLVSNATLSYMILNGLEILTSLGYTNLQINEFNPSTLIAMAPENRPNGTRSAIYANSNINSWIVEPQANYKRTIGKGKLEALGGMTFQQNTSNGQQLLGITYNSDDVLRDIKSAATIRVNSTTSSVYKYNAIFGRINFNWQEKYILNLNARRDGSSRFGYQNKFHDFGSIGAAWIFTQENLFMKYPMGISFGKLRASYGTTGNDQIGDYQFMNLYSPISVGVPYQNSNALGVNGLTNPYYAWEETKKLQFGLDLGFLRDRILLSTNYSRNRSSNQLLFYALPNITGFGGIFENFPATVQNTSLEFSFNSTNVQGRTFTWNTSINITVPRNKLIAFNNIESSTYASGLSGVIIGQPLGVLKKYQSLGVDPATGTYQFGDGKGGATFRPDTSATISQSVLINTLPKFYGGIQNTVSYKGFQLDFLFQFVKQIGANYLFNDIPGRFSPSLGNQPASVLNRWQKPGDINTYQRFNQNSNLGSSASNAKDGSDMVYKDASYIRLKNISLSWRVPEKWQQKVHLKNCRIYTQGQNLLTITKYKGLDPETQGVSSLPPLRVLTVGIQLSWQ
ncbi:hypothetical protein A3860_37980 [Niastella vici]|uniref:Secretin/TonB short N-terminal domain-containing protein n=1 Tax=Niastella vici TaxID=1703345 RepID=A0A1V9FLX1_9BACT|nr:SusC/RagA family TonB-linked outer membrane protein [Niastella vici]OQP59246.1 hypothetical protein A3860_37980 [Niastella vici]